MEPSRRTGPSDLRVPSKLVRSPIRLSTSPDSLTTLRDGRVAGKPTLTSLAVERKLGPDDAGTAPEVCAAAAELSLLSTVGAPAASSRSLDSAPRKRDHSCSSDFLNIASSSEGRADQADAPR